MRKKFGFFLDVLFPLQLFCCGGRRLRRRRKYDSEQPQALVVVHVDGNGSVRYEQKNGKHNNSEVSTTNKQRGDERNLKGVSEKEGYYNDGFDSDAKNKVNTHEYKTCKRPLLLLLSSFFR